MAAHITTRPACQIHSCTLEILGGPPSPRRNPRTDRRLPLLVRQQRLVHFRGDVPRRNAIHGDALARPLVGEGLAHLADGALGGRVGGDEEPALEGQEGGEVDDAAAAAGDGGGLEREHVGADVAAEREDGVEVYLHDGVEVGVGELVARVTALQARAVDEDGDLVAVGEDLRHQLGDLALVAQVGGVGPALVAQLLNGIFCVC